MAKILKYEEYKNWESIGERFVDSIINYSVNESKSLEEEIKESIKELQKRLKFDFSLVFIFGGGVKVMYPIVEQFIKNGNLKADYTTEDVVLLCITALSIIYLRENTDSEIKAEEIKKKLNAEVEMRFGNPRILVNKLVKSFNSIANVIKKIYKNSGIIINSFIDIFSYTSILIPTMNAISMFMDAEKCTLDSMQGNLMSMVTGISIPVIKRLYDFVIKKIGMKKSDKSVRDSDQVSDPEEVNLGKNTLIKEQ